MSETTEDESLDKVITKRELIEFIKENLTVNVEGTSQSWDQSPGVRVELYLEGEKISSCWTDIDTD
jgi:hypothetical protein